jgi:hypothetical protein
MNNVGYSSERYRCDSFSLRNVPPLKAVAAVAWARLTAASMLPASQGHLTASTHLCTGTSKLSVVSLAVVVAMSAFTTHTRASASAASDGSSNIQQ